MATLKYANPTSGKLASAIGWIDFTGITVSAAMPVTIISLALSGGATLAFSLSATGTGSLSGTAIPTWGGAAMGVLGYTGIGGRCALYGAGVNVNARIENITFKDRYGDTIPNFAFYFTDAEATVSGASERLTFSSDQPIRQVDHYPINYPCPGYIGEGTQMVTMGGFACTGNAYNSRIFQTTSPDYVIANLYTAGGGEAMALGLSLQQIALKKDIPNRINANDQFELDLTNISTALNLTTITKGTLQGIQNEWLENFGSIGDVYSINEKMATGSVSTLNQYFQSISVVNSSGGSIPTGVVLGSTIPLNTGDFLVVTIKNTPIMPYINPVKSVNKTSAFQGDILNYTVVLTNTSPNAATNVIFNDTQPTGTTFVPGSINLNGIVTTSTLPNIQVGTIPANSSVTITFSVTINTTIPKVTPISNSGTVKYSYTLADSIPNLAYRSNTVQTIVYDKAKFAGVKTVDKTDAKFGEILTYTLVYTNIGNVSANNLLFIDTIPAGTSFINNSLKVNGNTLIGINPQMPGIALTVPSTVAVNGKVTITFKTLVDTLINPTSIVNFGDLGYSFLAGTIPFSGIDTTNTVNTNVAYIDLVAIKTVDKSFSYPTDQITYTVVVTAIGNINADNVKFIDTIPLGTAFVSDSVVVNGTSMPGENPQSGINLGTINSGESKTITFKVSIL